MKAETYQINVTAVSFGDFFSLHDFANKLEGQPFEN